MCLLKDSSRTHQALLGTAQLGPLKERDTFRPSLRRHLTPPVLSGAVEEEVAGRSTERLLCRCSEARARQKARTAPSGAQEVGKRLTRITSAASGMIQTRTTEFIVISGTPSNQAATTRMLRHIAMSLAGQRREDGRSIGTFLSKCTRPTLRRRQVSGNDGRIILLDEAVCTILVKRHIHKFKNCMAKIDAMGLM